MRNAILGLFVLLALAVPVSAAPANTISLNPDPLPHGGTGTIVYSTNHTGSDVWAQVTLEGSGGLLLNEWHNLSQGDASFTPGPSPSWDGTGGADGFLRLVKFTAQGQKTLANGAFTYLP